MKGDIPPQDKYKAGQKLLGWIIIFGCMLFILTGYPMWIWRHEVPAVFLRWCYLIHLWDAVLMILAVGGHFFLDAIHPKSRVEFGSMMLDGYVDAQYTSHHNGTWFNTLQK